MPTTHTDRAPSARAATATDPVPTTGTAASARAARASRSRNAHRAAGAPRKVHPATCDPDYTPDDVEFMLAVQAYKDRTRRMFPTLTEMLSVARALGYRKLPGGPASH